MKEFSFTVLVLLMAESILAGSISCKDEKGNNVDWFYAYKLPNAYPPSPASGQGIQFVYMKPDLTEWTLSKVSVDLANSSIGYTMVQAYSDANNPNLAVLAYNDEPPESTYSANCGHTKGVLVADDQSGFWMIHSVPKFPNITSDPCDYGYPSTGHKYGQSFLCISVKADQVDAIGLQLIYNEPDIYAFQISDNLVAKYPSLVNVNNKVTITTDPYFNVANITSAAGVPFQSFAKSGQYKKELYEDLVAPTLNTDLFVESWRYGSNLLPSNCSQSTYVWNISQLNVASIDFNFTIMQDHSKWAVNAPSDGQKPWICVGDINRAISQERRGGGTVCLSSDPVARSYYSLITAFDDC